MIVYKATTYMNRVEKVEIDRIRGNRVYFQDGTQELSTHERGYFKTFEEAKAMVVECISEQLRNSETRTRALAEKLQRAKDMGGTMKKNSEYLLEMREKLAGGWCQGYFAKTERGHITDPSDMYAACFCVRGAARAVDAPTSVQFMLCDELGLHSLNNLADWNDHPERTHLEVVELVERVALKEMREGR